MIRFYHRLTTCLIFRFSSKDFGGASAASRDGTFDFDHHILLLCIVNGHSKHSKTESESSDGNYKRNRKNILFMNLMVNGMLDEKKVFNSKNTIDTDR